MAKIVKWDTKHGVSESLHCSRSRSELIFSNSLTIHQAKTKEITTVEEVLKCDLNYHKIL